MRISEVVTVWIIPHAMLKGELIYQKKRGEQKEDGKQCRLAEGGWAGRTESAIVSPFLHLSACDVHVFAHTSCALFCMLDEECPRGETQRASHR